MFWSNLWPWRARHAKAALVRRKPSPISLAVESLEDRLVPSSTATDAAYQLWRQQTFKVDDAVGANVQVNNQLMTAAVPSNSTFGNLIGLPSVFTNTTYRGAGYTVAVIDTGIDYNNTNLGGGFGTGRRVIAGWDFANNDADPMDDNGHGTHVAGIIGSSSATYSGVAPNVNLIALKVLDKWGAGSFGAVESALQWVAANRSRYNIVAVNLSLGAGNYTSNPFTFMDDEFATLKNNGVFISVASGNSFYANNSAVGLDFPAISPLVVSVGAVYSGDFGSVAWASGARDITTGADRVASFSQRGSALSLLAPGAIITSTYLNNTFKGMAGTSMAAPVVAGAAVLIHQAMDARQLAANQDAILSVMKQTGVNVKDGDDENDNVINTGLTFKRLDLNAALNSLGKPGNIAPVLQAIANTSVAPGGTRTITLSASDANGDALTYSASVVSYNPSQSQAYQLKQQHSLTYTGSYYQNIWGQNEKWILSANKYWFCILPNGQLRRWGGSVATTLQAANLIASLETRFYADPSLLWNAQPASGAQPTVSVVGNQLTLRAPAGAGGSFQVQVTASDGSAAARQTFAVTIQTNSAPVIAAIASQSMLTNRSQTLTLSATDAQQDTITYTAKILGSFATPPASLVINGNQLTISAMTSFVGAFDVQVTASDGTLASSTTFRVTVAAANTTFALADDFNADGVLDIATLNSDGAWWISFRKADGSFVNQSYGKWNAPTNWALLKSGDFNGDGKADILAFDKGGSLYVGIATGSAFASTLWTQWAPPTAWSALNVADVNGDGKADLAGRYSNGKWYVAYSTGATFSTQAWTGATAPTAAKKV